MRRQIVSIFFGIILGICSINSAELYQRLMVYYNDSREVTAIKNTVIPATATAPGFLMAVPRTGDGVIQRHIGYIVLFLK